MKALTLFVLSAALFVFVSAREFTKEEKKFFREWRFRHKKTYKSHAEELNAMKNLMDDKKKSDDHNKLFEQGKKSYKIGVFEHSDLSSEEKSKHLSGVVPPPDYGRTTRASQYYPTFPPGPAFVDWWSKGLVGPVENQGQCNSCYTFSTSAIVNALLRKKGITNDLVAPQQLIDCSRNNPGGCGGGWPEYSLQYVKQYGMTDEQRYPYYGYQRSCEYYQNEAIAVPGLIQNVYNIPTNGNETWLR